ncbi:Acyl-CoA dehydrogenase [Enhygromyxa salina]|uniref:Acyl-[acyl-carrier-protein] dehydrogenase MbtN n=1 Tax=Enhygromyxa salina TaxID=215803 RepID=A0A2S9XUJ1_9BACT|nr:acyl-CoA dehydrogenase family protein [Enhygromyxa salina]PRP96536.1 Acyl-CoA dehydrogenase [Enhygromyxa salina]
MKRELFDEDHDLYRQTVREFIKREVIPKQEAWMEAGSVDRATWRAAGEAGLLCPWVEDKWGGPGGSFLHSVIVCEELAYAHESGFAIPLHSDICVPYIHSFGDDNQRQRWLPGCVSGELITAIGMTEPNTGSDLAALKTTAKRDGDDYIINGSKTFISNGMLCDLCIVAAKTENDDDPHRNVSLFVVEGDRPGFVRAKKLAKMGLASQDTAELAFEDCRIPAANRLGPEGAGFMMLMQKLQQERLIVGIMSQAAAEKILEDTISYAKERQAFGRPIIKFQNTQFKLAECATEVEVGRHFLDAVLRRHVAGEYLVKECSMSKLWHSEMLGRVVDECLQFFGGYGYMLEYPISRAYMDARVQRIYAGTNEIMKVIIAKQMGI